MKHMLAFGLILAFLLSPLTPPPGMASPSFTCAAVTQIPQSECDALVAVYNSTGGNTWAINTNWLVSLTPSDWFGVTVESGHVTWLMLSENNLTGSLPDTFDDLPYLARLALSGNALTGPIPSSLGSLSNLVAVSLSFNQLSGLIPPSLGSLSKLTELYLSDNQFAGPIPPELGNLSSLGALYLDGNALTGSIPSSLGNLSSLVNLVLTDNQLTGPIPSSLGSLTSLEILRLDQNLLYGELPDSLVALTNLFDPGMAWDGGDGLSLDHNMLAVPSDYPNPSNPLHVFLSLKDPNWHLTQDSFTCGAVTEIPQIECEALVALYFSTNGPNWVSAADDWLQSDTPSEWYGVTVEDGHVVQLILELLELKGSIPPELGNLSELRYLGLCWNSLSGSIPPELGNLVRLQYLTLTQNLLSGNVPDSFLNLVNLYDAGEYGGGDGLYLDNNYLTVPPGYPDPSIPLHVFLYQKDPDWHLHQYTLSCATVTEIPQVECEALLALYSSTNGPAWGEDTNWLVTNTPSNWYGVTVEAGHVTGLSLTANQLSGTLPAELGDLSWLVTLGLDQNALTGTIPPELGSLSHLEVLALYSNQLSGGIPPALGSLSSLKNLYLFGNQLTGSIPPELGALSNLRFLFLTNNLLSGSIPPALGSLSNLEILTVFANQLSGTIPIELGSLGKLQILQLNNNLLTGSIPPALGNLSSLRSLALGGNQLSGSLPIELGSLSSLTYLAVTDNLLSGSIPVEIGNLTALQDLYLAGNQFSGPIPTQLGNLTSLMYLTLSDNLLSDAIPVELGNLTSLQILQLDRNQLAGDVPDSFVNLVNLLNPGESWIGGSGLNLDYNRLNIPANYPDPAVPLQVFLSQKDPDWHTLQAVEAVIGSEGGVLTSLDESTEIVVPDGTLESDTTFTFIPQAEPTSDTGSLVYASLSFELSAEDELGAPLTVFDPPLVLTLSYSDEDVVGILGELLVLYYWDSGANAWVDAVTTCPGGEYTRDLDGNTLSLPVCHLSEFALLGNPPLRTYLPMLQVVR